MSETIFRLSDLNMSPNGIESTFRVSTIDRPRCIFINLFSSQRCENENNKLGSCASTLGEVLDADCSAKVD
jgi:hypothetical protein